MQLKIAAHSQRTHMRRQFNHKERQTFMIIKESERTSSGLFPCLEEDTEKKKVHQQQTTGLLSGT